MQKIDDATKALISDRIAEVEKQCEGELVCLMTRRSARYVFYPILIAALCSMLLPFAAVFAENAGLGAPDIGFVHQTFAFVILALVLTLTPASHLVAPKWLKRQNCDRYSTEQFFRHQLHETRARNGVLIFVSWEEKYVTIIADKGINEKVRQSDWDGLIANFVAAIRRGDLAEGFVSIVGGAGDLLTTHFPSQAGTADELSNHLITEDGAPYIS